MSPGIDYCSSHDHGVSINTSSVTVSHMVKFRVKGKDMDCTFIVMLHEKLVSESC